MDVFGKFSAHTCMGLFLDSSFCSVDYVSVFKSVAHYFDCCRFVIKFEIRKYVASRLIFV